MTLVLRRLILKNLNSARRYNFLLLLLIRKRLITEHHTVRVGFPKKWKNCPLLTNPLGPSDEPLMHEINFTLGPIQKSLYLLLLYQFTFGQNRPKSDISGALGPMHYITLNAIYIYIIYNIYHIYMLINGPTMEWLETIEKRLVSPFVANTCHSSIPIRIECYEKVRQAGLDGWATFKRVSIYLPTLRHISAQILV